MSLNIKPVQHGKLSRETKNDYFSWNYVFL